MNKGDLVDKVAAANGISKTAAGGAIDTIVDAVTAALKKGDSGGLRDFFNFAAQGAQRAQSADRRCHQDCRTSRRQVYSRRRAEEGRQQEVAVTLSRRFAILRQGGGSAALLSAWVIRCRVGPFESLGRYNFASHDARRF
jgi:nucleoid DNA-binding protein